LLSALIYQSMTRVKFPNLPPHLLPTGDRLLGIGWFAMNFTIEGQDRITPQN
jgi:hypothetical protein